MSSAAMDAVGVKALLFDEYWKFDEKARILPDYELPNGCPGYFNHPNWSEPNSQIWGQGEAKWR